MTAETLPLAPGPQGHWFWGSLQDYRRDYLGFMQRCADEHGEVVRLKMGPYWFHLMVSPQAVRHVLIDHPDIYTKQKRNPLQLVVGNGLICSEGPFWKRQRKIAQPAFVPRRIAGFGDTMVQETLAMLDGWQQSAERSGAAPTVDIAEAMMTLTLLILGKTLFSIDLRGDSQPVADAFAEAQAFSERYGTALFPAPLWVPTAGNRRFKAAKQTLDQVVRKIIAERRTGKAEPNDLLSMMMGAEDAETGERMSDAELHDEMLTMLLAGHETSATSLMWLWYLVAQHPDVEARLRAELQQVLGERLPSVADLPQLVYLGQVLDETLRLYPPIYLLMRSCVQDDQLLGYRIPKGSFVGVSPYLTQRLPELWPEPDRFDPERFAPGHTVPKHAQFPFGLGPHFCIGSHFAQMEIKLIVATMLQRVSLQRVSAEPVLPQPRITLRAAGPIPMRVHPPPG